MAEIDRLSVMDATTLVAGLGLEAAGITGAVATLESSHGIIQKCIELGGVGVAGALGLGAIGYGVDRIRDTRHYRRVLTALEASFNE